MLSALHSAVIEVGDFDVGIDNYARLLGRPPARIEIDSERGTRSGFFSLDNTMLEIRSGGASAVLPGESGGATGDAEADAQDRGLVGLRLKAIDSDPRPELTEKQVELAAIRDQRAQRWRPRTFACGVPIESPRAASRGLPIEIISQETLPSPFATDPAIAGAGAARAVDPLACVHALDHVVVMSPDAEATRRFYEGLGIRLALDRSFEERGVRLLFFPLGARRSRSGASSARRRVPTARTDWVGWPGRWPPSRRSPSGFSGRASTFPRFEAGTRRERGSAPSGARCTGCRRC